MVIQTVLFDPEAPGRGPNPRWIGRDYHWERVNDFPIIGQFAGVLLGVTKGADTLIVALQDDVYVMIRYEHLVSAVRCDA